MSPESLHPFGELSCEDDLRVLKDRYPAHYFGALPFNSISMDPRTYLIVGRRGTGKSSLAHYFTFQDQIPNARCIDVDEPDIYKHVITRIAATAATTPEVAIPRIVRVWEYVIWALIFRELVDEDPVIAAACVVRDRDSAANIVLRILKHLLSTFLNDERGELADDMESYFSSELIRKAQRAAVEVCQRRPLIVAIDSLEHYAITDEATMRAAAALVECASKFNRDYARPGIHVKVFLTAEVYPQLVETVISNPLKYIRNPLFLHWRPKDLIRLVCWKLYHYMGDERRAAIRNGIDWEDFHAVCARFWKPFFGATLVNRYGQTEATFAYVLRHTQLRPRQVILLCNKMAEACNGETTCTMSADVMLSTVRAQAVQLASEVVNAYSSNYSNLGRIAEALVGAPVRFKGKQLDKLAPRTASLWPNQDYSPLKFRTMVAELGIVGRVRKVDDRTKLVEADFEYAVNQPLSLQVDDDCVVHPMFYERFRINSGDGFTVFPFPDKPEFAGMQN
jgi:hypothetical protein